MQCALTLIAAESSRPLRAEAAAEIGAALPGWPAPAWLAPAEACDFLVDIENSAVEAEIEAAVRALIGTAAIDIVLQPAVGRRKRLLVADLEATIIENEMLDELAELRGIGALVAEITRRAMDGEIDFVGALEARLALLAGMDCGVLDAAASRIRPRAGARALVATMRRDGAATALVSGGFMVFAEPVAQALGFGHVIANRLDLVDGKLTGTVAAPIVTGATKRQTLLALAARHGLSPAQTLAVGDGANDLPMLAAAGLGIAFHAKPAVAAAAGRRLDYVDLRGLLYAQGYSQDAIVEDA
jgi:phosphoserine phosphatase